MKNLIQIAVLISLAAMETGCGTILARSDGGVWDSPRLYPATQVNAEFLGVIGEEPNSGDIGQQLACAVSPLFLLDLPISIATDTLCLPFDIYKCRTFDKK